jgi:hypothetical protein
VFDNTVLQSVFLTLNTHCHVILRCYMYTDLYYITTSSARVISAMHGYIAGYSVVYVIPVMPASDLTLLLPARSTLSFFTYTAMHALYMHINVAWHAWKVHRGLARACISRTCHNVAVDGNAARNIADHI